MSMTSESICIFLSVFTAGFPSKFKTLEYIQVNRFKSTKRIPRRFEVTFAANIIIIRLTISSLFHEKTYSRTKHSICVWRSSVNLDICLRRVLCLFPAANIVNIALIYSHAKTVHCAQETCIYFQAIRKLFAFSLFYRNSLLGFDFRLIIEEIVPQQLLIEPVRVV